MPDKGGPDASSAGEAFMQGSAGGDNVMSDQPGAEDRSAVPGHARDSETASHQRASFNDPLPGGDPTAPGAPHEPGGEGFTQAPNASTSKAIRPGSDNKGSPGERE